MRICYVAPDVVVPYHRGASIHVHQVSKALAKRGHEVHVVCRRYSSQQREHEVIDGFQVHRIYRGILGPIPYSSYSSVHTHIPKVEVIKILRETAYRLYLHSVYLIFAVLYTVWIIQRNHTEVVLERETAEGCGALASIITGRPLVLEINGPRFSSFSAKQATKIMAYPRLHRKILQIGVPKDRIIELFAAVEPNLFKPNLELGSYMRKELDLGEVPVVGYVGIFAPWHGIETLLKASKRILKLIPETRFLMVGPYSQQWLKRTRDLKIADSFLFIGPVDYDRVPRYINASDVMVAPFNPSKSKLTRNGGFTFIPFKIIEYMSCGKPVVSTRSGDIPSILRDGLYGIIVEPGDETGLAKAILKLLRNPSLAKEMGRRGRDSLSDKYTWCRYADYLINTLEEALTSSILSEA